MNQFVIEINSYLTCYELVISGGFQKLSDTNCISKISQIFYDFFLHYTLRLRKKNSKQINKQA